MNTHALRYAIAQMLIIGFEGTMVDEAHPIVSDIREKGLGGVILFDHYVENPLQVKNIENPFQLRQLTDSLHNLASQCPYVDFPHDYKQSTDKKPYPRSKPAKIPDYLPLFISIDYEGGKVNRLKTKNQFPETLPAEIFATLSEKAAAIEVRRMARTLERLNINLNFAPVVDVNINPENPIIGKLKRSFSASYSTVVEYALLIAKIYRDFRIGFVYKHFPGHGSSDNDSHLGIVDVSSTWQPEELKVYEALLKKSVQPDMIMAGHIINRQLDPSGLPASLSQVMLTEILRVQLGYQGIIVADDLQMKAITDCFGFEEALLLAINAGNDVLIIGNQLSKTPLSAGDIIEVIFENVKNGKISEERIYQSLERIVHAKRNKNPHLNTSPPESAYHQHHDYMLDI